MWLHGGEGTETFQDVGGKGIRYGGGGGRGKSVNLTILYQLSKSVWGGEVGGGGGQPPPPPPPPPSLNAPLHYVIQ